MLQSSHTHHLSLTDTELRDLALLAYLGNQLANGRSAAEGEKPYPELHAALQKLYGTAYDANLPTIRVVEDSKGELSCMQHDSIGLDAEAQRVHDIMDDYDEQTAFEIVAEELANRDDHDYTHTPSGQKAGEQELRDLNAQAYDRYMKEFEQHGFERLVINHLRRKLPCQTETNPASQSHKQKP